MQKSLSPFSKAQLIPKEERLEIANNNKSLLIGIPKERSFQEKRICLTPDAVSALSIVWSPRTNRKISWKKCFF